MKNAVGWLVGHDSERVVMVINGETGTNSTHVVEESDTGES